MRTLLLALLLPCVALAQTDAPPPPERSPERSPEPGNTLVDDREKRDAPIPEKIQEPPPPDAAPTVSIRTDDRSGDIVEEYRQNGRIYMVKVKPLKGPAYSLIDTNGDGRLDETDGEGPVRPVYWTIYEWN